MLCFFHRKLKRQAMVCIFLHSLVPIICAEDGNYSLETPKFIEHSPLKVYHLELDKSKENLNYSGLFRILIHLENDHGITINPQNFPKIAINFDTRIAPGLHTSINLLQTVVKILELRGYGKEELILVTFDLSDQLRNKIRNSLPGYSIITSASERYFHPDWFHESPIPASLGDRSKFLIQYPQSPDIRVELERKSMLPACLFIGRTYWINLATAKDDYFLGIDGAASNVTLNASSNTQRFKKDKTMGPAAAIEMLAIPELWEKHLFSLIDLSKLQIAGSPEFNSEFIRNESVLLLSKNPIGLDYQAMKYIRQQRILSGLKDKNPKYYKIFSFARELGLGHPDQSSLVKLNK